MAIDTRDKRASAVTTGRRLRRIAPAPDGAITAPDRKHVAWSYRGITATSPTTGTTPFQLLLRRRRR